MITLTFLKNSCKKHGQDYTKVLEDIIEVSSETGIDVESLVEQSIDKIENGEYGNY